MSVLSTSILALSLSMDAFAVSVGRGAAAERTRLTDALRSAVVFGGMEGVMPVLGWLLGLAASRAVDKVDHWIAFCILAFIGAKMIKDGWSEKTESENGEPCANAACQLCKPGHKFCLLVLTAVGTSVDSLAVGVSLALIDANIWLSSLCIGFASFSMSTLGLLIGRRLGQRFGARAEILGGLGLIGIGAKILGQHLGVW